MDYEKEYKSLVAKIKKAYLFAQTDSTKNVLVDILPELREKESEDERVRKFLVQHVSEWIGCIEHDLKLSKNDVESENELAMFKAGLAYLERQKAQKPLMCDGEIEDKKRDIVAAIRKYYPADYAEYLTSFLKGLSPEDNSEDEYGQEMLGIAYKLMYEHIPENLRTQEFWDSLKFMREYTGKVAIIHSYEKPAEWSEEDSIRYISIGTTLETSVVLSKEEYDANMAWLRELVNAKKYSRPMPSWKPSKEQMEALDEYIWAKYPNTEKYSKAVLSLRDDLKKQM